MDHKRKLIDNNRGFLHLHLLSIGFFFLALVGAWHIYTSYKNHQLSDNITMILNDYKNLTMQAITSVPDRQKVENNMQEINQIVSKTPGVRSVISPSSKSFYNLDYPYSK